MTVSLCNHRVPSAGFSNHKFADDPVCSTARTGHDDASIRIHVPSVTSAFWHLTAQARTPTHDYVSGWSDFGTRTDGPTVSSRHRVDSMVITCPGIGVMTCSAGSVPRVRGPGLVGRAGSVRPVRCGSMPTRRGPALTARTQLGSRRADAARPGVGLRRGSVHGLQSTRTPNKSGFIGPTVSSRHRSNGALWAAPRRQPCATWGMRSGSRCSCAAPQLRRTIGR